MNDRQQALNLGHVVGGSTNRHTTSEPRIIYYSFPEDLSEIERQRRIQAMIDVPFSPAESIGQAFVIDREPVIESLRSIEAVSNVRFLPAPEGVEPEMVFWNFRSNINYSGNLTFGYASSSGDIGFEYSLNDIYSNEYRQTIIHEVMHRLGAKHPHERGVGVYVPARASFGRETPELTGDYDSRDFTVMSYNDGAHNNVRYIDNGTLERLWNTLSFEFAWNPGAHLTDISTPMPGDIVWLQNQFGANTNTNQGNTTYNIDNRSGRGDEPLRSDREYARTIYDAGGEDAIDASRNSDPVTIRLSPDFRRPSIIGSQTVFIAYGTVIERALGGSAADILSTHANGASTLEGGGGNDNYYINGSRNIIRDTGSSNITLFNGSAVTVIDTDTTTDDRLSLRAGFEVNRVSSERLASGAIRLELFGDNDQSAAIHLPPTSTAVTSASIVIDDPTGPNVRYTIPNVVRRE